nr:cytochrome d ubiquinol oxidase subunit II [Aestuariivirga litoralis]
MLDYPLIWAFLIAVAVMLYVILDGFDLGIGTLFLTERDEKHRDVMMNTIAPVWDGNETWLVLGGGGLLAVFPLAYSIILPALYLPLTLMLLGLILRGVAFEFRPRATHSLPWWDWAFFGGSALAAFMQGVSLGTLVHGIPVANRAFAGGSFDWFNPFSLLTGLAVLVGYATLGACWLILKTSGDLQKNARIKARVLGVALLVLIGIVSLWTPFINGDYFTKWLVWPAVLYTSLVPALVVACAGIFWLGLNEKSDWLPFVAVLGVFIACFIGLGISFYPYIVPTSVTIWEAAGPDISLSFLLAGTVVLLPIILIYTAHAYWVFRGKTDEHGGYH